MRIAYVDCFAGISGDMMLGALIDAGVPHAVLTDATAALKLGARLEFEKVDRSGISSTKVHVLEGDRLADAPAKSAAASDPEHAAAAEPTHRPEPHHQHGAENASDETSSHRPAASLAGNPVLFVAPSGRRQERPQPFSPFDHKPGEEQEPLELQPQTQHMHRVPAGEPHTHDAAALDHSHTHDHVHADEHQHEHEHAHTHGRSLSEIRTLISNAELAQNVKDLALHAFQLLGESEAKIHNVPVEHIHFHEVGAVDAIVDIVAASAGLVYLGVEQWFCSPLNVGGGMVQCAHGNFPVPAPAVADMLRGLPTYSGGVKMELVTPTGAALVRALAPTFTAQPPMRVEAIGYGAGTRNPERFPNVLRLSIGELSEHALNVHAGTGQLAEASHEQTAGLSYENVAVLETALDDLSPQLLANVAEKALAEGALDVMLTPVIMKKGRPGTLLTLLAAPADRARFEQMLLRETSTLGVRVHMEQRACLDREHVSVGTAYGPIRVKTGKLADEVLNATPEFEDCRAAALEHHVPVKLVQQAAVAAFHHRTTASA